MEIAVNVPASTYNIRQEKGSIVACILHLPNFPGEEIMHEIETTKYGVRRRHLIAGLYHVAHPEYARDLTPEERDSIRLHDFGIHFGDVSISKRVFNKFNILPKEDRIKYYSAESRLLPDLSNIDFFDNYDDSYDY